MSQDTSRLSTEGVANVEFTTLATCGHFERGGWGFWEVSSGRCMDDPILRKSDDFGGRIPNLSRIRSWKGRTCQEIGPKDQGNTYNPTRSSHTFKAATRHPWQPLKYLRKLELSIGNGIAMLPSKDAVLTAMLPGTYSVYRPNRPSLIHVVVFAFLDVKITTSNKYKMWTSANDSCTLGTRTKHVQWA